MVELCDCAPRKENKDNKPRNKRKTKREATAALEGERPKVATVDAEKPLLPRTSEGELVKGYHGFPLVQF